MLLTCVSPAAAVLQLTTSKSNIFYTSAVKIQYSQKLTAIKKEQQILAFPFIFHFRTVYTLSCLLWGFSTVVTAWSLLAVVATVSGDPPPPLGNDAVDIY
jgi:hypothetical protein